MPDLAVNVDKLAYTGNLDSLRLVHGVGFVNA
jgi:hypothetical protein